MFYTYVLKSKKDDDLYIGFTNDLKNRFAKHNRGEVRSTASRRPFELIYYEACLGEQDAIKREKYFKTGFGRRFLNNRLEDYRSGSRWRTGHEHQKLSIVDKGQGKVEIRDWRKNSDNL